VSTFSGQDQFGKHGRKQLAWFSGLTGAGFFAAFAGVASGSTAPAVMIAFYVAVLWIWTWHTVVLLQLLRDARSTAATSI
jgi:hypothetical protein